MKKLEIRVKNPRARKMPPRNSDRPAAHAKNTGTGKPKFAAPVIKPSPGGTFPIPCENANATPANIRNSVSPAFAKYDNPDSPPKSMVLSNGLFLLLIVYFVVKEWHNLIVKTIGIGTCKGVLSY